MNIIERILSYLTAAVTVASLIRVGLYRFPDLAKLWVPPDRPFWLTYARVVESFDVILGWISGALAKYGKSNLLSPEHQEMLREKPPEPVPPPPPIAVLDSAKEEPAQPPVH